MNKYIRATILLVVISLVGVWWIMSQKGMIKTSDTKRDEAINAIYPTTATSKKVTPTIIKGKVSPTSSKMIVGQPGTKGGLTEDQQTQTVFESVYSPDRKLYIENEYSGVRYVLYRSDSKITVHTGNSWSWVHPGRSLTHTGVVPGQKTFTYEIGSQKIVDFAIGSKKYTIQCVHNGVSEFKEECDKFLKNFKLI